MTLCTITQTPTGYTVATYRNGRPDPDLVELFGTHVLPLPFGTRAAMSMVIQEFRQTAAGREADDQIEVQRG